MDSKDYSKDSGRRKTSAAPRPQISDKSSTTGGKTEKPKTSESPKAPEPKVPDGKISVNVEPLKNHFANGARGYVRYYQPEQFIRVWADVKGVSYQEAAEELGSYIPTKKPGI